MTDLVYENMEDMWAAMRDLQRQVDELRGSNSDLRQRMAILEKNEAEWQARWLKVLENMNEMALLLGGGSQI